MVRRVPSILGLNPEKSIEAKLAWLTETLDRDREAALRFAQACYCC